MKTLLAGSLVVHAAGGTDRSGGGDGPSVLLCHGFGAPGEDLVSLHRVIDAGPSTRWFFPEAPIALEGGMAGGRAWWPIDMMKLQMAMMRGELRDLENETPDGLPLASSALLSCIDALIADHGVDPAKLVIGGFSQGAMLTTEISLIADRSFAGLAVLSGTLLSKARWVEGAKQRGKGLHVFQSHGRRDPVLPFSGAEALHELLKTHGAHAAFTPFGGQHEIPQMACEGLGQFLRARLG